MKTVRFGDLAVGEGLPKICVPIVAKNLKEVLEQLSNPDIMVADLIEFRGDHLIQYKEEALIGEILLKIRLATRKPVIYTFRTAKEGGEQAVSAEEYEELLTRVLHTGRADLVDIELLTGKEQVNRLTQLAHQKGVRVLMSSHDFEKTPDRKLIVDRLKTMEDEGADIAKMAVMPENLSDVVHLIEATVEAGRVCGIPVVTMSMGRMGAISRVAGEIFGSCITFGTSGQASAPGQIECKTLAELLDMIHKSCG